jgi:hypothetical protein
VRTAAATEPVESVVNASVPVSVTRVAPDVVLPPAPVWPVVPGSPWGLGSGRAGGSNEVRNDGPRAACLAIHVVVERTEIEVAVPWARWVPAASRGRAQRS